LKNPPGGGRYKNPEAFFEREKASGDIGERVS